MLLLSSFFSYFDYPNLPLVVSEFTPADRVQDIQKNLHMSKGFFCLFVWVFFFFFFGTDMFFFSLRATALSPRVGCVRFLWCSRSVLDYLNFLTEYDSTPLKQWSRDSLRTNWRQHAGPAIESKKRCLTTQEFGFLHFHSL